MAIIDEAVSEDRVVLATLIRGRVYVYKDIFFDRNVPVQVSPGLGEELEELVYDVSDSDGEQYEKPWFKVEYDAPRPSVVPPAARRGRVQAPSADRSVSVRRRNQ